MIVVVVIGFVVIFVVDIIVVAVVVAVVLDVEVLLFAFFKIFGKGMFWLTVC